MAPMLGYQLATDRAGGPSGTFWRRLRRQAEAARAGAVPVLAVRRVWLMYCPRPLATQPISPKTA